MPLSSVVGAQSIIRPGVCTSSTRPASPYDGQVIYETDTDKTLVWNGTGWVFLSTSRANAGGLDFISSATASAVSSVSINNCFSSTYQNYKIVVNLSAAVGGNNDFTGRLRVGGVDATTNYATQRLYGNITTAGAQQNTSGTDEFFITNYAASTANTAYISIEVSNPAAAAPTSGMSVAGYADVVNNTFFTHTTATAYDGITFITSGTSFTGTIRIYGYVNS